MISRFGHLKDGSKEDKDFNRVVLHPKRINVPFFWQKPKSIFICSMGDLFHDNVPAFFIHDVLKMIGYLSRHTFYLLTKRPENIQGYLRYSNEDLPKNAWVGVSVENQEMADERIPALLKIRAEKYFVSVEPLLGQVDLEFHIKRVGVRNYGSENGVDWVIAGCESGQRRRLADIKWFRSLKNQCVEAGVPFFLKQMDDINGRLIKMPILDGVKWNQKP
jgi:protein gp37